MNIKIAIDSDQAIRVIPRVQEGTIVWIEGYNGAGKSVAATLLEIAFGNHVFLSETTFKSLKTALKSAEIEVFFGEDSNPIQTLRTCLEPTKWELNARNLQIDGVVGDFWQDSSEISQDKARNVLGVRVIRGNETIAAQLELLVRRILNLVSEYRENTRFLINQEEDYKLGFANEVRLEKIREYKKNKKELEDKNAKRENIQSQLQLLSEKRPEVKELIDLEAQYQIKGSEDPIQLRNNLAEAISNRDQVVDEKKGLTKRLTDLDAQIKDDYEKAENATKLLREKEKLERQLSRLWETIKLRFEHHGIKAKIEPSGIKLEMELDLWIGNVESKLVKIKDKHKAAIEARQVLESVSLIHDESSRAVSKGVGDRKLVDINDEKVSFKVMKNAALEHRNILQTEASIKTKAEQLIQEEKNVNNILQSVRDLRREIDTFDKIERARDRKNAELDQLLTASSTRKREQRDKIWNKSSHYKSELVLLESRIADLEARLVTYNNIPVESFLHNKIQQIRSSLDLSTGITSLEFEKQLSQQIDRLEYDLADLNEEIPDLEEDQVNMRKRYLRILNLL